MAARAPWLSFLLLVSLCELSTSALLLRRLREHIQKFQESSSLSQSLGPVVVPKQGWLEQPLDPFNASDRRTFLQRYWVNDQHRTGQDAPVFLHVGGEGSLGPGSVMADVTCESPQCPFSQLPALPFQLDLCEQVFGLLPASVAQAVAQTNSYYGGQTPGATRVLFVNGDTDPWHVLSVTQNLGPSEPALLIPTASHCFDMAPVRPSDPPSLCLGRQRIFQQLQAWLKDIKNK